MKILALETSGKITDICILDTETDQVWEKQLPTLKGVAEVLTTEINDLLTKANLQINEIELIAVGIGPGSYTGTRVGIATAKGLAQGLNIPIVGITSFEALIEAIDENYENNYHPEPIEGQQSQLQNSEIIPLIDARNQRVYYQINSIVDENGIPEQGCENIEIVLNKLKDKNYVFVGTGATVNKDLILERFGKQAIIDENENIESRFIAQIADGRAQNNLYDDIIALKPLYINKTKIG